MTPTIVKDMPNVDRGYAELLGDVLVMQTLGVQAAHFPDLTLSELTVRYFLALRLAPLSVPIFDVVSAGAQEKMGRVNALRVVTVMADEHTFGYRSVGLFPCAAMSVDHIAIHLQKQIAKLVDLVAGNLVASLLRYLAGHFSWFRSFLHDCPHNRKPLKVGTATRRGNHQYCVSVQTPKV